MIARFVRQSAIYWDRGMLVISSENLGFPKKASRERLAKGGLSYKQNTSGQNGKNTFEEWFHSVFIPKVEKSRRNESIHNTNARHLLILDGHKYHYSVKTVTAAIINNNIDILIFPPHMTHRLQLVDVALFGRFKDTLLRNYRTSIQSCSHQQ